MVVYSDFPFLCEIGIPSVCQDGLSAGEAFNYSEPHPILNLASDYSGPSEKGDRSYTGLCNANPLVLQSMVEGRNAKCSMFSL